MQTRYTPGQLQWPLLPACASALMRSSPCSARVGWGRFTKPATPASIAPSPSRSCPPTSRQIRSSEAALTAKPAPSHRFVFPVRLAKGSNITGQPQYAVMRDRAFVLNVNISDVTAPPITVVLNRVSLLANK